MHSLGTRGVRLEIDHVNKVFGEDTDKAFEALRPATIDIQPGEFVSVVGPSGCGKSTLMLIVAGLLKATNGVVRVGGNVLSGPMTDVGIAFQDHLLLDFRTAVDNVLLQGVIRKLPMGPVRERTDELFERLADDVTRPSHQVVLTTKERRPLTEFPVPAYELAQIDRYLLANVQFSSGCPYQCEFCDIPALYGRVARYKTAEQVCAELDKLLACGLSTSVYFVDDNFIANKRAVREMLPHLIEWQKRNGYPLLLSCEATLNIAKRPEILELMREANFTTIFCGIETPEPEALKAMSKEHNMMVPMLGAIETLNSFGMEVVSGIIMGLDTDTSETGAAVLKFVEQSQIPMLTMNLLQALPRTPLWDRLKRENRLIEDAEDRESNVEFRLPYDQVLEMWRKCMRIAYRPENLIARYEHQVHTTYANRLRPDRRGRASWRNIRRGLTMLSRICWHVGVKGDYRRVFWRFAAARFVRGEIEYFIATMLLAHHLILFAREASAGRRDASNYNFKPIDHRLVPAE